MLSAAKHLALTQTPTSSPFYALVFSLKRLIQQTNVLMPLGNIQCHHLCVRPVQVITQVEDLLAQLVRTPYCTEKKLVKSRLV